MSESIRLGVVAPEREEPIFRLASVALSESADCALGGGWRIDLALEPPNERSSRIPDREIRILSLSAEAEDLDTAWPDVERRVRAHVGDQSQPIVLMTAFRATGEPPGAAAPRRERIRRLNLLAAEISQETGATVADADRALADIGARVLETDDRLGGELAASATARVLAESLLAGPLGDLISPEDLAAVSRVLADRSWLEPRPVRLEMFAVPVVSVRVGSRVQKAEMTRRGADQVGQYLHQILTGRVALSEAISMVREAIARRGWRHCLAIIVQGLGRPNGRRESSAA